MNTFQKWLKECKEKSGLTYPQIAERTGLNYKTPAMHISGQAFPHFYTFMLYIDLFGKPDWADGDLREVYDRVKRE